MGTLIEHYGGAFPVWLSPTQVQIIPIKPEHESYAGKIKEILQKEDIRSIIDARNESLNKRIREGTIMKIPYLLIIGDKEINENKVAVRRYGQGDQGTVGVDAFLAQIKEQIMLKK